MLFSTITRASTLMYSNFDVKGAFLWVPRSNDTQIIMRLPSYIDHPLAGCEVEVLKSIYGLKDSNANFDADLRATIVSAGFRGTLDPCIYVKEAPNPIAPDIPFRCIVSTHVDDGRAMYNHRPFYDDLIRSLESRYGLLSKDDNTTSYTGSTFDSAPDGSFLLTQAGYIQRLLDSTNLTDLTVRSTPSDSDLFGDTSDTPPCHAKTYRQLVGSLIHLLRTRYDIQKEVVHLSSKMTCPTEGDMAKGIKVLQYLKGTPTLAWGLGITLLMDLFCVSMSTLHTQLIMMVAARRGVVFILAVILRLFMLKPASRPSVCLLALWKLSMLPCLRLVVNCWSFVTF